MSKKLFVFSDVHSYYDEFIKALTEAGYDENNENHWLIGLGDYFDRGPGAQKMYEFLMSHTERTILIKGNHDDLMQDLIRRGYYESHDLHNGTVDTIGQLAGYKWEKTWYGIHVDPKKYHEAVGTTAKKIYPLYDRMIEFFETKNYVFCHGFIPVTYKVKDNSNDDKVALDTFLNEVYNTEKCYDKDWREAQVWQWEEARWLNGIEQVRNGIRVPDKTIVFGHWHCSWGHAIDQVAEDEKSGKESPYDYRDYEFGELADFTPYYYEGGIGIDACTAHSGKCNILVLEDDFLDEH